MRRIKSILMVVLSDAERLKAGIYKSIVENFSKRLDKMYILCLGDKKIFRKDNVTFFSGSIIDWVRYASKIKNIDLIFATDYFVGGFFCLLLSKFRRIRFVLRCGSRWKYHIDSISKFLKSIVLFFTKPIVLWNAERVVYNSRSIVDRNVKNYEVVYNGVDIKLFKPSKFKKVSQKLRVLFIGRICPEKGLDYLFDAIKPIKDKIDLGLIGKGKYLEKYKRNNPFADFYGPVKYDKMPSYINKYDLVVLPSLRDSAESFPNVILEAMACGKPVVATNVWGIPEIVENGVNGFLIHDRNSSAIRNALEMFLNNRGMIRNMGEKARNKIETCFEEKVQIEKLYSMLLDEI